MGFFEQAVASYRTQGRTSTIGEIISKESLTKNIVAIDVRWPSFDDQGRAKAVEMPTTFFGLETTANPASR